MPVKARAKKARRIEPGATRERLVDAARALLEEGGYAATSVLAVADRAGVSAGALYRHFPSKAELFVEVLRANAKIDQEVRASRSQSPERTGQLSQAFGYLIIAQARA